MTDFIGLLELPVQVPAAGEAAGDPFLNVFGAFLQAVINANTKDAWAKIHKAVIKPHAEPVPVAFVKTHDPDEADFRDSELPTLFVFRGKTGKRQRVTQDLQVIPSTIHVLWVPPRAQQQTLSVRQPFKHAIEAAIDNTLQTGRHPAWVLAGDTDPNAADNGSNIYARAKLWGKAAIESTESHALKLQDYDGRTTNDYDCFLIKIEITEVHQRGLAGRYDLLDHAEHGIFINEDRLQVGAVYFPAAPYIRAISYDTCPTTGGVETLEIRGQSFDKDCTVLIGGVAATDVELIDDTQINCLPPAHASGVVDILITDALGRTSLTSGAGLLTYV